VPRTKNKAAAKYTILVHILIGDASETRNIVTYGCIAYTKAQPTSYIYTIPRHALLIFIFAVISCDGDMDPYLLACTQINK
jgi:hypothetical protein